ncbi:response regulator [Pedococcus sp. 5OH_020]|uniref:response regulator n=1 Tax=Pedococcus sp. 5OH_020 TaxID=2989814 RepID=UPI0022E9BE0C|nr:response regulator [Pedococcus sp. 5OH_020]
MVGSANTSSGSAAVAGQASLAERLTETQEQLAATSEILAVLGTSSSGQMEVFDAIVERARRLCRADATQIHLVRDDTLAMVHSVGLPPAYLELASAGPVPRNRASLIGRVSLDGRTQQIVDVLSDPDYNRPEFQRRGGYRTIMGAPMVVGDEVVGVLSVWRTRVDRFDDRVCSLLSTFAAQGALALRNVGLFHALESRSEELSRKVAQLEALAQVSEAVSASLDPDEVLTTIVTHAVRLSETDGGSLMEYDEDTELFRVRTAYGTSPEVIEELRQSRIHVEESFVGRAAASDTVAQIPDLSAVDLDPHLAVLHAAGWRSLVAIPMTRPDRIVGALVVRRKQPGGFSAEICELLSAFASQSTIALVNARLYQELERQSAELAEASRHKSEFLASMSHELRTPLNAVIGFSEVLLERMFGDLNERQADYLQDILGAGRHLLALLNDILDLSKVEAGRMELELRTFDAAEALASTLALVRERASQHGIALSLDAPAELGAVWADPLRFKQIVLNLLSNAVKFTPDDGSVRVTARREEDSLVVTVEDTGVGIPASDQARIFDSFQQAGRNAASAEGTGLGLTLTRRIVELHGGTMWLDSEPGRGSIFGFSIPLHAEPVPEAGPAQWELVAPDERPLVVVIDDDESSAELVSVHITAAGLHAVPVRTGEQGLAAVRSLHPAAVILDIRLPGMDGWAVLSALKADPETAELPVVVVSVLPEQGHGFALGASDYLVKPVRRDDLLAALRRVVVDRPEPEAGARRILVIDDDPTALELVRATLEPLGWDVRTCGEGTEAQAIVRAERPAVILVDLLMPDPDGFRVIDQVHADPATRGTPIVVLTAKTLTAQDRRRLRGRVEFVAGKGHLDLVQLSARLASLTHAGGAAAQGVPS